VQNLSKAQIFSTCSQNQKIFKTGFGLNVEFEHRVNGFKFGKKNFEDPMRELSDQEISFKIA
jgi:hypothetical protein